MSDLKSASWNFAMDIFNVLLKESPSENVFLSPMSIMAALSMTLVGARGGTETELKKALHLTGANDKALHDKVGGMMAGVTKGDSTKLANRIFSEKTFSMLSDFKALLTSSYAAELGQVDFKQQSAKAVTEINAWVESNTNGRIKDLLTKSAVDGDTRLVLVNAIHFKGIIEKTKERLCVSKVIHKAFLEVNEAGAEAAAATAVVVKYCRVVSKPVVLADHPFLLLITHQKCPTFIGRVASPTAA